MSEEYNNTKKRYILYILDVIKENSDENNPIDFPKVKEILEKEYGLLINSRTFWRNITSLQKLGYPIYSSNVLESGVEVVRDGKELRQKVYYDWNDQEITDQQIYLLIDSVLSSSHITAKEADETIKWLRKQASVSFRQKYSTLRSADYGRHIEERIVLGTIWAIDEAIRGNHQMKIDYNDFNEKGNLELKGEANKEIIISPYVTVIRQGHYYLICCKDGQEEFYHYRIDKISNPQTLYDTTAFPIEKIDKKFDLNTYLQQHPYMFAGKVRDVRFSINKKQISALFDYFGDKKAFKIEKSLSEDERAEVTMKTNIDGFFYWALQYGESVEILEPQELRDKMRATVRNMTRIYSISNNDMYNESIRKAIRISPIDGSEHQRDLSLNGIDLRGKRDHLSLTDIRRLYIGYNNVDSYEFINRYKKLITLHVTEPGILNDIILNLPELKQISIREEKTPFDPDFKGTVALRNFEFLSSCQKLVYVRIYGLEIDSFEGIYDLPNLECIDLRKEQFEKLDLTRFNTEAKVQEDRWLTRITFPEVIKRAEAEGKARIRNKKIE